MSVATKGRAVDNILWSFNDSTPSVMTDSLTVKHKYAMPGSYWVTATVLQGAGMATYR